MERSVHAADHADISAVAGIVFNCDGTLIDSMPLWHAMEEGLARRAGVDIDDELRATLETSTLNEIVHLFHTTYGVGESEMALSAEAIDFMRAGYRCISPAKRGVIDFINEAARRNVRMGVVSLSPKELLIDTLEHSGILEHMAAVISVGDLDVVKRGTRPIKAMRRFLGTLKTQTWCFDDSPHVLDTYMHEGYHTVGVIGAGTDAMQDELADHAEAVIEDFTVFDYPTFFDGRGIVPRLPR